MNDPINQVKEEHIDVHVSAKKARRLLINFVLMSVCFAVNHGTVTTVIALATTELGVATGSLSLAVLYAWYVLTALFFSSSIVNMTGRKGGLVLGAALYCVYVGSFLVALRVKSSPAVLLPCANGTATNGTACHNASAPKCIPAPTQCLSHGQTGNASLYTGPEYCPCGKHWDFGNGIVTVGSALGGVAAGFLWTAQGAYFTANAEQLARATGTTGPQMTAKLSGIFAFFFLLLELVLKGLTVFLQHQLLFVVLSACAVLSTLAMCFIMPLRAEEGGTAKPKVAGWKNVAAALVLMGTDMKVLLMLPTQAAFGFSAAMMNAWVNGFLVTKFLGSKYTGSLSALTTVVAWLASQLASWYSSHGKTGFFRGKPVAMLFGDGAFITLGLVVMLSSCDTLRSWPVVIALFVLQGLGRGIFESTNKATFADFFPGDKSVPGFANQIILSGSPSVVFFFIVPQLLCQQDHGQHTMGTIVVCTAGLAVLTYLLALQRRKKEQANESLLEDARMRT